MKKLLLFLICIIILPGIILSQPTLNYPGNTPLICETFAMTVVLVPSIDPGPAGPNQTWDFSAYTSVVGSVDLSVVSPSTTPFASDFTNSTTAVVADSNFSFSNTSAVASGVDSACFSKRLLIVTSLGNPASVLLRS